MDKLTLPLENGVTRAVQAPVNKGVFMGNTSMPVYAGRENFAAGGQATMLIVPSFDFKNNLCYSEEKTGILKESKK